MSRKLLLLLAVAAMPVLAGRSYMMDTPRGQIEFYFETERVRFGNEVVVEGRLTNHTRMVLRDIQFEMIVRDRAGNDVHACQIDVADRGVCKLVYFGNLQPGASSPLAGPGNQIGIFHMPPPSNVGGGTFRLIEARFDPLYTIVPVQKSVGPIAVRALLSPLEGFLLQVENSSDNPVWMKWGASAFVNLEGNSSPVVPDGVRLGEKERGVPDTLVPPHSKLAKTVYPSELVGWSHERWIYQPILPANLEVASDTSYLQNLVGKTVRLFVSMKEADHDFSLDLPFRIDGVEF